MAPGRGSRRKAGYGGRGGGRRAWPGALGGGGRAVVRVWPPAARAPPRVPPNARLQLCGRPAVPTWPAGGGCRWWDWAWANELVLGGPPLTPARATGKAAEGKEARPGEPVCLSRLRCAQPSQGKRMADSRPRRARPINAGGWPPPPPPAPPRPAPSPPWPIRDEATRTVAAGRWSMVAAPRPRVYSAANRRRPLGVSGCTARTILLGFPDSGSQTRIAAAGAPPPQWPVARQNPRAPLTKQRLCIQQLPGSSAKTHQVTRGLRARPAKKARLAVRVTSVAQGGRLGNHQHETGICRRNPIALAHAIAPCPPSRSTPAGIPRFCTSWPRLATWADGSQPGAGAASLGYPFRHQPCPILPRPRCCAAIVAPPFPRCWTVVVR